MTGDEDAAGQSGRQAEAPNDRPRALARRLNTVPGRLAVFGTVYLVSFFIGMEYGRLASKAVQTEEDVVIYLHNNLKYKDIDDDVVLRLDLDVFSYIYSLNKDAVLRETRPPDQIMALKSLKHPPTKADLESFGRLVELGTPVSLGAAGGATLVGSLKQAAGGAARGGGFVARKATLPERVVVYVATAAAVASGGYFGYRLTYSDKGYFNPEVTRKTLEDPASWRTFAQSIKLCRMMHASERARRTLAANQSPTAPSLPRSPAKELERCSQLMTTLALRGGT